MVGLQGLYKWESGLDKQFVLLIDDPEVYITIQIIAKIVS